MLRLGCAGILMMVLLVCGCSPKRIGMSRMADALAATATTYRWDNDIELVRAAAPSTLKLVEMMLDQAPDHAGLLATACSGFTQYAYGFLQLDSEIAEVSAPATAVELKSRAARMYERARGYCLREIETRHRGFRTELAKDGKVALARVKAVDVPALFWLGVSWGGELAVAQNQLMRLPELVTVRLVLNRALELDESWERGAIHEALIAFDGMPALLGGSVERATRHFERAVALSEGQSAFAYVTMASSVSVPARDRAGFERHLKAALAIDVNREPTVRLANLLAQKRARFLMSRTPALFASR
ncbi:MAG TPA: TRAP transporter TatT component family protein [Vicinamibacterales bacterium]|nr:TRAP transporter TatT component family protein [Vicinamibacterales bacterium]